MSRNTSNDDFTPNFGSDEDESDYSDFGDMEIDISEAKEPVFHPLPRGTYPAEVIDVEYTLSKSSGKPMLKWTFGVQAEGDDGKPHTRKLFMNDSLIQEQYGRVKAHIKTVSPEYDLTHFVPRRVGEELRGCECQLRLDTKVYQGKPGNEVKEVLPAEQAAFLPAVA